MASGLPQFENPSDFKTIVAIQFKQLGYEVEMPEKNQRWHGIKLVKG